MKLLIIGGTYFLGRVFSMLAGQKHELTLVNRGRYSLKDIAKNEYHFDRHETKMWQTLPEEHYDAVIDFCAYEKNDIETVIKNFPGSFDHYVLISTVDVYKHRTGELKAENAPLETTHYSAEIGAYIDHKIQLEKELTNLAETHHFKTTVIRPGNIYGPFNYAPRESQYIALIINNMPLVVPEENDGYFQMVYVKDVARAILMICENPREHSVYNIVAPEMINYQHLYNTLKHAAKEDVQIIRLPYQQALNMQYPFCYPVFKEETELYDGSRFTKDYAFEYTSLEQGMIKTYQAFYPVFSGK